MMKRKSINWSKNSSENESQKIENLSKFQIRKRMLKSIFEDSHKLIKVNKRSTLTDSQLVDCFGSDIFTDESSEYSAKSDEDEINTKPLTSSFKIILSETDGNCLFHTLNKIDFGGQFTAEYIRDEICDFIIIWDKYIYEHLWEGNLDNHITNMRKDEYWGTNLELLAFLDLMRLNIKIYTSLDQDDPEFKIDHPQNTGWINIFLRSWRYYGGLQSLDGNDDIQIDIIENLKIKNWFLHMFHNQKT